MRFTYDKLIVRRHTSGVSGTSRFDGRRGVRLVETRLGRCASFADSSHSPPPQEFVPRQGTLELRRCRRHGNELSVGLQSEKVGW